MKSPPIYLDYQATTPVDPDVLEAMLPFFNNTFGNPSSSMHAYGWDANMAVNNARKQTSELIGAKPKEIIFTSGATEANNWVLQGALEQWTQEEPPHLITTNAEHRSVLEPFQRAQQEGAELTILPVDKNGQVTAKQVQESIKKNTILISVIFANNEIGSINPIGEIGAVAKEKKVLFHSDGTQAVGKIPVDVKALGLDFLSLSAHKFYGPKGVGALFIRSHDPKCILSSMISGGGQERGLRSGTVNVPGVVGLGQACEIAGKKMAEESQRLQVLRDQLIEQVTRELPQVVVNGHPTQRLCNNISFSFPDTNADEMIRHLRTLAISSGSACSSSSAAPSYILKAIGLSDDLARTTYRIGLGRPTTEEEVLKAGEILISAAQKSRKIKTF